MQKDTSEIVKQLQLSPDFQTFYRENREYMVDKSLAQLLEQVQNLLKAAGYSALYVKRPFDSVVLYGIFKKMSVAQINELLYDYGMETLGQTTL